MSTEINNPPKKLRDLYAKEEMCACKLPLDCVGRHGWHWRQNSDHPTSSELSIAFEHCPAWWSARHVRQQFDKEAST